MSVTATRLDPKFKYEVAAHLWRRKIKVCFACGLYAPLGCPVSEIDPAYNPRKIIRMVLLGMREEILKSDLLWLCINCYTCTAHCPQNVKLPT